MSRRHTHVILASSLAALVFCVDATGQSRIANATMETRSASQGLEREIRAATASRPAAWIGYRLAAVPGARHICSTGSRILLESPTEFFVLARVDGGKTNRVRAVTPECEVDAGGMTVIWLNDVKPSESVDWLASLVMGNTDSRQALQQIARPAMTAIGLHADAGPPKLLQIARTTTNQEVRKQAMSLLSESSDPRAISLFEEILKAK